MEESFLVNEREAKIFKLGLDFGTWTLLVALVILLVLLINNISFCCKIAIIMSYYLIITLILETKTMNKLFNIYTEKRLNEV